MALRVWERNGLEVMGKGHRRVATKRGILKLSELSVRWRSSLEAFFYRRYLSL